MRARWLCEQLNRPAQLGLVLYGQYLFRIVRGELEQAEHHAEELRHMREELTLFFVPAGYLLLFRYDKKV